MACQVVNHEGKNKDKHEVINLGGTIGYYETDVGKVMMELHDYSSSCTKVSGWGSAASTEQTWRQTRISFECADVGAGEPRPFSLWRGVETETCMYEWLWESIFACPVSVKTPGARLSHPSEAGVEEEEEEGKEAEEDETIEKKARAVCALLLICASLMTSSLQGVHQRRFCVAKGRLPCRRHT